MGGVCEEEERKDRVSHNSFQGFLNKNTNVVDFFLSTSTSTSHCKSCGKCSNWYTCKS